ncbi:hypothetical protein [Streptomyces sp. NRRL S-448]|uniref:hypothetical protein n=1 Tax=Streptomyces sp. NRRL S-448 TaxID=1463907 RepID=UPI0035612CA0
MSELPSCLIRNWVHSFEEDVGAVTVYRPVDFPFPPARGRRGLEFAPDGIFIDRPIGGGDAPDAVPGRWRLTDGSRVIISFPGSDLPDRGLEIMRCGEDILEIRSTTA